MTQRVFPCVLRIVAGEYCYEQRRKAGATDGEETGRWSWVEIPVADRSCEVRSADTSSRGDWSSVGHSPRQERPRSGRVGACTTTFVASACERGSQLSVLSVHSCIYAYLTVHDQACRHSAEIAGPPLAGALCRVSALDRNPPASFRLRCVLSPAGRSLLSFSL